ncbi:MAG: peptidylprolyl isomerase [Candidatus Promineifilaceae bacterium]|jgi:peptidyl-prolyl cis-trans isomerase C
MKRTTHRELAALLSGTRHFLTSIVRLSWIFLSLLLVIAACTNSPSQEAGNSATATPPPGVVVAPDEKTAVPPEPSPTLIPPSPTPQLAALVNGQPILLEAFEEELMRYETAQAELGFTPGADGQDYQRLVLDALIERELISQAAKTSGISVDPAAVDARLAELYESAAEADGFEAWLAVNHWTEETFREALAAEMLVEAMIADITADVPFTAEQVRASYIQVDDAALADSLLQQIDEGADFSDLAARYSRDSVTGPAGGDLGFFARGSLLVPEVEDAAYRMQPGEVSDVISVTDSETGKTTYYILEVTERDRERPLNTNLRYKLLQERFDAWLADQWANATIVYLLEDG